MAAHQLWFWPPPRPLVERFGDEFFRQVPAALGVYLLCGAEAGVLYVGKAKNLRRRLAAYRVANPERLPRRNREVYLLLKEGIKVSVADPGDSTHYPQSLSSTPQPSPRPSPSAW